MTSAPDPDRSAVVGSASRRAPERLRKRPDFLRVAKGRRFFAPAFGLQAARLDDKVEPGRVSGEPIPAQAAAALALPRFGLTITKKTGNAVERNRMRRRLREVLKQAAAMDARPGCDYVIVAQRDALSRPFASLVKDLEKAVAEINSRLDKPAPPRRPKSGQDGKRPKGQQAANQVGTGSDQ